jgi:ubiquinone/menaquinone biosynthesis C-methylase UbiE
VSTSDGFAEKPVSIARCSTASTDAPGQTNLDGALTPLTLPFTGERMVPGQVGESLFREHEARYVFASTFVKDKVVLDVACGTGIGTQYLLKVGARSCLGLDIDGPTIEYARAAYNGCQFAQCDATNLCVPDSSMDVVVSFETIEHLRDPLKFLSECIRVLRPGGIFICSTPNRTMYRLAIKNPYHLHEFKTAEFARSLESMFVDVRLFAQGNANWLLYAGRRLLSRVLDELQLKNTIRKVLRLKPAPLVFPGEFDGITSNSGGQIQPYHAVPLVQPMFVIAVARKSC